MIYIHAGRAKCASTTIQRFLWGNVEFLRAHGRIYPDLQTPQHRRSHHALPFELKRGQGSAWQTLRATMERREPSQHIVLSSENFNGSDPSALRAAFPNEDVRLIFYIKDLGRLILSRYAHATKTGSNTVDFDAFFEHTFAGDSIEYPRRLAKWCEVFGAPNVTVRTLDPDVLFMGDVRTDVLDAVGIAGADIKAGTLEMSPDRNVSPGWKSLEAIRALPRDGFDLRPAAFWETIKYIDPPPGFDDRGQYLTQDQFDRCADRFDSYVDEMGATGMDARLAHTRRTEFVARRFLPSAEHVPAAELAAYQRQLSSTLLSGMPAKKPKRAERDRSRGGAPSRKV